MASRAANFRVERRVLDELRLEELSPRKPSSDTRKSLVVHLKDSFRCSLSKLKHGLMSTLPVLYWFPKYSIWDYGMPDLISGISVGIMHLPQGMAYALLASLPPVFGLYTSLYPALVYFFFGTSRHISIGTFAVLSIMVGSVTERLAPDVNFRIMNGTNITSEIDLTSRDSYRVQVAAATTVLGGLIQVVLGLVKFGFVGTYLSEPLVRAYTTAAAAHAVVAQLKYIFGVSPTRFSGPLSLVYTLMDVCVLLPQTHLPTLAVSLVSMVFLIAAKELNSFLSQKLPVPIPVELITVVAATFLSNCVHLSDNYSIPVVGEIPSGLSPPQVPDVSIFGEVAGDAFAIALVAYAISISLGKTFALKHGYKVDSNQELVALGLSNAAGGFFQCYSVCASMSRSLIQETTGGKTQMAGVASAVIVLVTILKLGPLFQELPKAVLAAIVFVNLKGMFKQYADIVTLWRSNKIDLVLWLVTWVATLLFNLDLGLAASIAFALLTVIFRTQLKNVSLEFNFRNYESHCRILYKCVFHYNIAGSLQGAPQRIIFLHVTLSSASSSLTPTNLMSSFTIILIFEFLRPTYSVLGNVPGTELYVDIETHQRAKEVPGVTIFRSSATVYFANADLYLEALKEKSGLDISKMIIYKRRQEAKQRRRQRRAERRAKRQAKREAERSAAPVFSVEDEAERWRDACLDGDDTQGWAERQNGTVFVVPPNSQAPDGRCRWEYLKGGDPESHSLGWVSELQDGDTTTLGSSSEDTLSRDLERVSLGSLGKWTWDIHSIILDLSTANFIDTVAMKTIKNIFKDFSEIDVDIYMAGCQTSVVEQLELGGFFSETITKELLFVSVHDAVLHCLDHRGAASIPRYEPSWNMDADTKL